MNPRPLGIVCAGGAFALDQATKEIALRCAACARDVEVLPFFNLVLVRNDGVSFGMLGGIAAWWALALLSMIIVAMLLVWLWRSSNRWLNTGLGFIIGGALGNTIDRLRHEAVIDFLDFFVGTYHWPAFNFADVAIFCGAFVVLLDGFRNPSVVPPEGP